MTNAQRLAATLKVHADHAFQIEAALAAALEAIRHADKLKEQELKEQELSK